VQKATERDVAQQSRPDFPIVIASMPASTRVRRIAFGLFVLLSVVFALIAPFAGVPLARVDAFVPVLQTVMCVADVITALLLFAQYTIQPQRALLALAGGYVAGGLFGFLQTLAFPGAYAPTGLFGDELNTAAWLFVLWQTTFTLGILVYALTKDTRKDPPRTSTGIAVGITVACTLAVVAGLTWLVTAGAGHLPTLYVSVTQQVPLANDVNIYMSLLGMTTLVVLFLRRRTVLDIWLIVTLVAWAPNFVVAAFVTSVRFSLGWYAGRIYALIASCTVLAVLLAETTMLYARLANAVVLLRREHDNRLMSVEAATSAMAHEIKQPLAGIAMRGTAALNWLKIIPPDLDRVKSALNSIIDSSHRVDEIMSSIRGLFQKAAGQRTTVDLNELTRQALSLAQYDLQTYGVSVAAQYHENLPRINADRTQLQQVILNLIKNAIEAMDSIKFGTKRLRLVTSLDGNSMVSLSIQDSGPGISDKDHNSIFDPFFTTKPTGTGLGLSICRTIVQSHGGSLRLTKTDARGSTFEIALPTGSQVLVQPERTHAR
jgi:signal transduction histidine kinase